MSGSAVAQYRTCCMTKCGHVPILSASPEQARQSGGSSRSEDQAETTIPQAKQCKGTIGAASFAAFSAHSTEQNPSPPSFVEIDSPGTSDPWQPLQRM